MDETPRKHIRLSILKLEQTKGNKSRTDAAAAVVVAKVIVVAVLVAVKVTAHQIAEIIL